MLTQWLCGKRHAAFAIPWDDTKTTAEEIEGAGAALRAEEGINDHCGICLGPIAPEHGRTTYASVEQALPALLDIQGAQLASRRTLDALGLSAEKLPGGGPR
jgi:hypothetical protein